MKRLLLISCLCCATAAYAVTDNRPVNTVQPKTKLETKLKKPDFKPWTNNSGYSANSAALRQKVTELTATKTQAKAGSIQLLSQEGLHKLADDAKKQKLDSVVCTLESTGEKISIQEFTFDKYNLPELRVNSLWDATSQSWTPVETYGYTWDEDGYCLSQWGKSDMYNSGQRYDYTYNDRKLGISQIIYEYNSGEWYPSSKGEYTYDDKGNIIEEYIYGWDGTQWVYQNWTKVSYDEKGRQTSWEGWYWNGTEWYTTEDRQEYEYNEAGSMTLYSYSIWQDDSKTWLNYYRFEQEFNENNLMVRQEVKVWNPDKQAWVGDYDHKGYGKTYNVKTVFEYDEQGRETKELASELYNADEDYVSTCEMTFKYTPLADNAGTEMYRETYMFNTAGTEKELTTKLTKWFNNDGLLIYSTESQNPDGFWCTYYDETYTYDERGNLLTSEYYTYDRDEENKRYADINERYIYDDHDNIVDSYYQMGQHTGEDDWVNVSRFTYAFEQDTVRVDKLAYRWDGADFVPNWGEGIRYDFDTPVSEVLTWPAGELYHKVTENITYLANGAGWDRQVFKYHYSDINTTGINGTTTGNSSANVELSLNGDVLSVSKDSAARVNIYSAQGARMLSTTAETVSIGCLAPGLYIVEVNGKATKIVKR